MSSTNEKIYAAKERSGLTHDEFRDELRKAAGEYDITFSDSTYKAWMRHGEAESFRTAPAYIATIAINLYPEEKE